MTPHKVPRPGRVEFAYFNFGCIWYPNAMPGKRAAFQDQYLPFIMIPAGNGARRIKPWFDSVPTARRVDVQTP